MGLDWIDELRRRARCTAPLVAVVAGSGQVVRCAVEAKADLIFGLSAGVYRHVGSGSLASFMPYGNSNFQTRELLTRAVMPRAANVPVVAGVCGHDPTIDLDALLAEYVALGVVGITNWPALGFIDGAFRAALAAEGVDEEAEMALLSRARARGLATFGFVLDRLSAQRFAAAGCDALVLDVGLTRYWADVHEHRDQLRQSISQLNGMAEVVRASGRDPLCLAFGGPVVNADDFAEVLRYGFVHGFAGGSVFERLPVQDVVTSTISRFKGVADDHAAHDDAGDERGLLEMVGRAPAMKRMYALISRVAPTDVNVCIEGESGTGKELVATAIHRLSHRANQPFVTLNCGALPDSLVESELFGHERGAFTGAERRRLGKFELAHGGTLFLDEVADLSLHAQVALLRAIQSREITRLGGERSLQVDVRVVVASHQALAQAVADGRFRADLYYRLNHFTIQVPALRERREDIPLLVARMMPKLSTQLGRTVQGASPGFLDKLSQHAWPGNVRELQHAVMRCALLEDRNLITGHAFTPSGGPSPPLGFRDPTRLRQLAERALSEAQGNKSSAAAKLGITRKTLYGWLRG
jgi:two-component system response regulator HydG